jgi:DNA-directed RNA polymerase specialized sigma24 family protein
MFVAEPELRLLLEAYQLRNPELSERFYNVAKPILWRIAKKYGWGLPKHAIEDVVQETFLTLSNPQLLPFVATQSTARQYLSGHARNAVKTVQVQHGLRRSGSDLDKEPQREFVQIDDLELNSPRGIPVSAIQARHTLDKLFAGFSPDLREACMRVFGEDESQASVAEEVGMNRFAFARRFAGVKAIAMQMAAAA